MLIRARCLENSFQAAVRTPPDVLSSIASYFTEKDLFSASQICHYWRSVLISTPFLWTPINCRSKRRTLTSLARCKHLPIQLRLGSEFSTVASEAALLHESGFSSLVTRIHRSSQVSFLRKLLASSPQSLEKLHICDGPGFEWAEEAPTHRIWDHLPSVRELLASCHLIQIGKLNAPNLVHLALERTGHRQTVTVRAVLDMLCECPLLETLLLSNSGLPPSDPLGYSSVCLPRLRSIELGENEVHSGLVTSLQFSRNIAAGFRTIANKCIYTDDLSALITPIQHILGRIDSRSITLTASPDHSYPGIFVRFEGPGGSLEITTMERYSLQPPHVLLALERMLSFPIPGIENVTELHIVGCSFDRSETFHRVNAAMRSIVCTSFLHCDESQVYRLLTRTHDSLPPFPHLERIMILGHESKLEHMARRRMKLGVPIKTLVLGRECRGFWYTPLKDYTVLRGLVGDLRAGCPTEILEWGTGNDILQIWSPTKVPVSPGWKA